MSAFTDKLAKDLKDAGVERAFGIVGSGSSLELITALENLGVTYYPVAHEAAAVLMAGACSRGGKTKAVAVTIKGPGFANAFPGIVSNFYENRPALTISESYSPSAPPHKMHKRLNHESAISSVVKVYARLGASGEALKKLISIAEDEIPGPAHLDLTEPGETDVKTNILYKKNLSDKKIIGEISEAIKNSKNPVLVLGSMVLRRLPKIDWSSFSIPVVTTAAAKGAINENHASAGGIITGEIKELSPEKVLIAKADLVLSVGLRNTEVVAASQYAAPHINIDLVESFTGGFNPKINFIAEEIELGKIILELRSLISKKTWGSDLIVAFRENLEKELFFAEWMPANVFRAVQKALPESAAVLDTGLFCTVGETVWKAKEPENFLGSSNGRFMGTAIPTAIGFAMSSKKETVCFAGDGGVRDYFPEIKVAIENKLPIIFVFMSDGGYGSVGMVGRPKGLNANGFDIKNGSWWRAAEAIGCDAQLVESEQTLLEAVSNWKKEKKPLFLEFHFDQARYEAMANKLR